jgi:hypothetical protein
MMANTPSKETSEKTKDEDLGIMIYGNVKIRDLDTGKILVNQRA